MKFSHEIFLGGEIHRVVFDDDSKTFSTTNFGSPTVDLVDEADGSTVTVDRLALEEGKIRRKQ